MSEESTGTVVTFDDVVAKNPVLEGLPDLMPANSLKPLESAHAQTVAATVEALFNNANSATEDETERGVAILLALEQALKEEEPVMRGLAVDKDGFDEWEKGKKPVELAIAYYAVLQWYVGELGK